MFSGDTGRHPRRNRSAAAPPRTQGHVAGQSIHGRHGPTTAPIATGHAHAHLIRHRACEQPCPAPTARPATPGRGCHRPPRPTFAVTVQEHLNSTRDHQKVCTSTPNLSRHFVGSVPSDSLTLLLTRRAFSPQCFVFRQLPCLTPIFARRAAGSEPARRAERRAGRQGRATGLRAWCKHRLPVGAVCYARCGWDISVLQGRDR